MALQRTFLLQRFGWPSECRAMHTNVHLDFVS
jgi:hypothetical protein